MVEDLIPRRANGVKRVSFYLDTALVPRHVLDKLMMLHSERYLLVSVIEDSGTDNQHGSKHYVGKDQDVRTVQDTSS